jgi:hypothetical protein
MGRSRTWYVTASTIASRCEIASIMVRLMLSINDLSLANNSIIEWSESRDRKKLRRRAGGELYYVRILMGHVCEALKVIKLISESPPLREAVMDCERRTVEAFVLVESFVKSSDFAILNKLRNKAAFHYDIDLPIKNLKRLAKKRPDDEESEEQSDVPYACSMGPDGLDYHFELGDMVMNTMLIRDIFKQDCPKSEERRKKVGDIAMRQQEIARAFTHFAAHFIRHYSK